MQSTLKLFALLVFFLVGFGASLLIGVGAFDGNLIVGLLTQDGPSHTAQPESEEESDPYFPQALHVRNGGDLIAVSHSEALLPSHTTHFAVFSWFKFKRSLKEGETVIVLSKQVGTPGQETGYGIGVTRRGELLRPAVFWRNDAGKGGGYLFTELSAPEGSWIMLLVGSVPEKNAIFVHSNVIRKDGSLRSSFHGSHEFSEFIVPDSEADLNVGSKRIGTFRGFLGSFGVFQGENLQEVMVPLRDALGENPLAVPTVLPNNQVKLFVADSKNDLSPMKHQVFSKGFLQKSPGKRGGPKRVSMNQNEES